MDRAQLLEAQAPIKERYRSDPQLALVTLRSEGQLDEHQTLAGGVPVSVSCQTAPS